jgi:cysteinyl-tRNA synthetase
MAKRVGNVATVGDLRDQGVSPAAFRHFVFSTHYRKQLNLSAEALAASVEGVRRVGDFVERLESAEGGTPELAAIAETAEREARDAFFDDLNAPEALDALFRFIRAANAELNKRGTDKAALERARSAFAAIDGVLDIVPRALQDAELQKFVEGKLEERKKARAERDFARADSIRDELVAAGIEIKDGPSGTSWKKLS